MKPEKTFDCVQMKTKIQESLLKEIADFGEEEASRRRRERLATDPILHDFLDRKKSASARPTERTPAA